MTRFEKAKAMVDDLIDAGALDRKTGLPRDDRELIGKLELIGLRRIGLREYLRLEAMHRELCPSDPAETHDAH